MSKADRSTTRRKPQQTRLANAPADSSLCLTQHFAPLTDSRGAAIGAAA